MADLKALAQQCRDDTKLWFPEVLDDLGFMGLALSGEVGELNNIIKKVERGSLTFEEARADLAEEAVDVLIYLGNIFAILGVDPTVVYNLKRRKNHNRFGRNGD